MGARPLRIRAIRHFNTFRKPSSANERVEQTAADIELNPAKLSPAEQNSAAWLNALNRI